MVRNQKTFKRQGRKAQLVAKKQGDPQEFRGQVSSEKEMRYKLSVP